MHTNKVAAARGIRILIANILVQIRGRLPPFEPHVHFLRASRTNKRFSRDHDRHPGEGKVRRGHGFDVQAGSQYES